MASHELTRERCAAVYTAYGPARTDYGMIVLWQERGTNAWKAEVFVNGASITVVSEPYRDDTLDAAWSTLRREFTDRAAEREQEV